MKPAFSMVLLGLLLLPLRAEDWTATDGKSYENVQVLSHNAAYVTILDSDGGARIRLSTLPPDLQKRFGYDSAKAPAIIAATQAADERDKQAVAAEKDRMRTEEERQMDAISNGIAAALFSPVPAGESVAFAAAASNPPSANDMEADVPPIASEPPTEIDDWDYSDLDVGGYGYGYGYGGYGRGYRGYGRGYGGGSGAHFGGHSSTGAFTHR
jgi:hypothetical protein